MSNLKSRIRKVETGIDVARLNDEQLKRLDISRLSFEQVQALDVTGLSIDQLVQLDVKSLTDAQLVAVRNRYDEENPKMSATIRGMTDEELRAAKEGRLWLCYPGYIHDSNA
jgi:hypothetical protein